MSKNYVQIDPKDNIIVAITPLEKGLVNTQGIDSDIDYIKRNR